MEVKKILASVVQPGASEPFEFPKAVPAGERWTIKAFGAADINTGDNKSSVFILRFGTEIVRILSLTGNTRELPIMETIEGDGTKKVSIERINTSSEAKRLPCWLLAFKNG